MRYWLRCERCANLGTPQHVAHPMTDQRPVDGFADEVGSASLERATADKGGHRVKAIQHVDAAIAEVRAGMRFDRKR